ncbi:MAG: iron uptake porin [Synechocystis sp.]|nr:iron uptake porin [Synechocystis sp.]
MINRSVQSMGLGLLGGLVINGITGTLALANPVAPAPFAPQAGAVNREVAEATYNQDYQDYSQLLDQVTSISQFRDVSPTEWSFEALKNLVENYGCIVGYPDRTYRGDRPLTRNEFAAGLSACLTQLERRMMESKQLLGTFAQDKEVAVAPGDTLNDVFTRAFYNSTGRFYDLTSVSGQANKIFGWRSWPGSYMDNMIAEDAAVVEAVYDDAMRQQTEGAPLRTMDLGSPFDQSLRNQPSYTRFGNPPLPPQRSAAPNYPLGY